VHVNLCQKILRLASSERPLPVLQTHVQTFKIRQKACLLHLRLTQSSAGEKTRCGGTNRLRNAGATPMRSSLHLDAIAGRQKTSSLCGPLVELKSTSFLSQTCRWCLKFKAAYLEASNPRGRNVISYRVRHNPPMRARCILVWVRGAMARGVSAGYGAGSWPLAKGGWATYTSHKSTGIAHNYDCHITRYTCARTRRTFVKCFTLPLWYWSW
jgi:hypothetical protein